MKRLALLLALCLALTLPCAGFSEAAPTEEAVALSEEDAAMVAKIAEENPGLDEQAAFFRGVLPLTLKQSYNFSAYAQFLLSDEIQAWSIGLTGRDYSTLPELMQFADGRPVTNSAEDLAARRAEMLDLLKTYVYGPIPSEGYTTTFAVLEEGTALDGAAHRKQVQLTVTTEKGSLPVNLLLYTPAHVEAAPVIMCLTSGNYTVLDDAAILPDASETRDASEWADKRGSSAGGFRVAEGIAQGYGYAFISVNDVAPDANETYATKLVSLFDEPDFMALSAWAFGLSRAADYLVTDPAVDASKLVVFGHSRYGKAALWAGANDERIALVLANASGGGGAALNRANNSDNISSLTKMEPWWFCANYASYSDKPDELPVDSHFTIACVAPRKIYVGNGDDDLWADPQGSLNGLLYARPMFEAYGLDVIPAETYPANETRLTVGDRLWAASMGCHLRDGFHDANADDWANYFEYMNTYLK